MRWELREEQTGSLPSMRSCFSVGRQTEQQRNCSTILHVEGTVLWGPKRGAVSPKLGHQNMMSELNFEKYVHRSRRQRKL